MNAIKCAKYIIVQQVLILHNLYTSTSTYIYILMINISTCTCI